MRTITASRAKQSLSLAATSVVALTGCGGTTADKAGGTKDAAPIVLTMASANDDSLELDPFVAAVCTAFRWDSAH